MNHNSRISFLSMLLAAIWIKGCSDQGVRLNVNIIVDDQYVFETLSEADVLNAVTSHFEFAQSYFEREFDIHLRKMDIKLVTLTTENIQSNPEILRPDGTHIAIVYAKRIGDFGGAGRTYLNAGNILMNIILDNPQDSSRNHTDLPSKQNAYKWLLVHELAHLFGAIDLQWEHHLMDEKSLFSLNESDVYDIIPLTKDETLIVDEITHEIIKLFEKKIHQKWEGFDTSHFSDDIGEKIIALKQSLIPKAAYPDSELYLIALYYYNRKQFDTALDQFNLALELKPKSIGFNAHRDTSLHKNDILIYKSLCLEKLNQIEESLSALLQMDDNGPKLLEKYHFLGSHYLSSKQHEKAIETYRKITSTINPNDVNGWFVLGLAVLEQIPFEVWEGAEIEESKQAFEQTVKLDPNHLQAHAILGAIYQAQNNPEQAKAHLNRVMELGLKEPLQVEKDGKHFAIMPPQKKEANEE